MRAAVQLFLATGAAGATVDTGQLDVEEFHSIGWTISAFTAATGPYSFNVIDETGAAVPLAAAGTIGIGVTIIGGVGRDVGNGIFPVTRRIQLICTGAALSVIIMRIWGIRDEPVPTGL